MTEKKVQSFGLRIGMFRNPQTSPWSLFFWLEYIRTMPKMLISSLASYGIECRLKMEKENFIRREYILTPEKIVHNAAHVSPTTRRGLISP